MTKKFFYVSATNSGLGSWLKSELREIYSLLDFLVVIKVLIKRNVYTDFHQTVLGPLWLVLQPLLQSVIFTLVFGKLANISTDGVVGFFFYNAAILSWSLFTSTSGTTAGILLQNKPIMSKIYVPKLLFPISNYIYRLMQFSLNFVIFLCLYFSYEGITKILNVNIFYLLLGILLISATAFFSGLIVASLTTVKRDLQHIYTYAMQAMMYLSPVIYPMSSLSYKYQVLCSLNPVAVGIELIRYSIFGAYLPSPILILFSVTVTLLISLIGYVMYAKAFRTFVDTL